VVFCFSSVVVLFFSRLQECKFVYADFVNSGVSKFINGVSSSF